MEQRKFRVEDSSHTISVREILISDEEDQIEKDDTIAFIDSSTEGWGLL